MVVAVRRQDRPPFGTRANELDGALDVGGCLDGTGHQLDRERRRRGLGRPQEVVIGGRLGVGHESGARKARRDLLEHRQPLAGDARLVQQHAREIAARPRQARDEA